MNNRSRKPFILRPLTTAVALACATGFPTMVNAQSSSVLLEEVIVTARKRAEVAQEVPLAVSAFNSDQIDALKVRDLTSLSVGMPNVALDDVGTTRGTANFSIRGLGINSSIPSIDPTVGVFVNGVYLGVNNGIIFDTFDLESIEVLRGPQGILFGRNVTGGAILMNTKKPGDEFEATVRAAIDTGGSGALNQYYMGTVGGPITDSFGAKLTAYYNEDEGWFENQFDGSDIGAIEQTMIRPTITWMPTENMELVVRWEHTEIEGDGPVGQSHTNGSGVPGFPVNHDRDSFDVSIDERGFQDVESDLISAELNWDVGENGTITYIFGYRDSSSMSLGDIDAQPVSMFHAPAWLDTEQTSNELRYNTLIADKLNLTVGGYQFSNEMTYHERRNLLGIATPDGSPALTQDGGGIYEVDTVALFAAVDYDLTDALTLTAGLRYTEEEKSADIASLVLNQNSPCNVLDGTCPIDFSDSEEWDSWSPKLGATYHLSDDARVYAHWVRGFRSGGYNLRNTSTDVVNNGPGPFDQETVDSYEIGFKSDYSWGRLNAAAFYNTIDDMQREVNLPDPGAGVVQIIKNTADATITGIELDATIAVSENFLVLASLGWIDPEYDEVLFDLNGDGMVDDADKSLSLPRAAELTWSLGFNWDVTLGEWGYMTARANYAYRDDAFYTDNNLGYLLEQDIVNAGLDFYSNSGNWVFSLYGKNLTDSVNHGGDTQLPAMLGPVPLGGTFSPLVKGAHYGAEVTYNFF